MARWLVRGSPSTQPGWLSALGANRPHAVRSGDDPGARRGRPRGRGPVASTGSGIPARLAAPARSTARCSRWRRNGGGGACVPLSVDGQALLVHNRTRLRPYVAHGQTIDPRGRAPPTAWPRLRPRGQGTPRGCGPVGSIWPQAIQASWSDSAKVSVNTPKLGAVSRPTATWFMAPRVTRVRPSR